MNTKQQEQLESMIEAHEEVIANELTREMYSLEAWELEAFFAKLAA